MLLAYNFAYLVHTCLSLPVFMEVVWNIMTHVVVSPADIFLCCFILLAQTLFQPLVGVALANIDVVGAHVLFDLLVLQLCNYLFSCR